jgi:DNA-binding MarR family transcriptional regulator
MARPAPDEIAQELRQVVSALKRRWRSEVPGAAVPYPQLLLLHRLEAEGPSTTADLARAERVTPQAAGELVAKLEAGGYVTRRDDANDGRRRLVTLRAAGRKALADGNAQRQSWLAQRIATSLDASEQQVLVTSLSLLRKLIAE